MATLRVPPGLGVKGTRLWRELHKERSFNPAETVLLEEACRIADRLDRLNALLIGEEDAFTRVRFLPESDDRLVLVVNDALSEARQQANVLKQIVAALRLPDEATGERPQRRGARGAYSPSGRPAAKKAAGTVTALDRARAAREA